MPLREFDDLTLRERTLLNRAVTNVVKQFNNEDGPPAKPKNLRRGKF